MRRAVWTAVVVALAAVALAVFLVQRQHGHVDSVSDLDRGDCVDAAAFLDGEQPLLSDLTRADCDDPHDAEVLMVLDVDAGQAAAYRPVVPDPVCVDALGELEETASTPRLQVAGLGDSASLEDGDALVCFGFAADGRRLDGRVLTR